MDFELTEAQRMFADSVHRFARSRLEAGRMTRAHTPGFPFDVAREMGKQGLLGITIAERDGGQGGDVFDAILAIEQVASVCPRSADVVQAGNFGPIRTFAEYAPEALRKRHLPDLLRGETVISLAMSESAAGSAVTDLTTRARKDGREYVIDGNKLWSTHSPDASVFLVYVRFSPGVRGIGALIVERGTPGFTVGEPSEYMSAEQWCPLYFDGCRVPEGNLIVGEGGFKQLISGFNVERLGNSARALALGRFAFDLAREHASTREQFGRALCEFQGIQWKFADAALDLEAARLLLYRAASRKDERGLPLAHDTVLAKLACNQAGFKAANEAVQVMGAMGYSREALAEYCMRRTRGWMIAGGSIEMMKNRLAEQVFERRFDQRPSAPPV